MLIDYLEEAGCYVEIAENGVQAITELVKAASTDSPYGFLISNLHTSNISSFELPQTIRSIPFIKNLLMVIMVYFAQKGEANLAKEKGYDAFLTKPITRGELLSCLCETLHMKITAGKNTATEDNIKPNRIITKHSVRDSSYESNSKILLAEDNITNQKLIVILLAKMGFICDVAENGKEAVEACRKQNYSLLLMDCQMPIMSGYEATAEIRKNEGDTKHTIIIALTADAMKGDKEKCIAAGMDDYLSKPVRKEELVNITMKYIGA
jgi:CheY-like chemotaxis protein